MTRDKHPTASHISATTTPLGATVTPDGVEFRAWAPGAHSLTLEIERRAPMRMRRDAGGIWSVFAAGVAAGATYAFRIDGMGPFPDPYSRSQPEGPHGSSEVVDPGAFLWHDADWRGLSPDALVFYELHVAAYTPDGTFEALIPELDALEALGVTAIELMPVAEFPGSRNWGYDGVDLFAPSRTYGGPDGLRRLVDAAHARGVAIILDVVYNHFGPDGNYLPKFAREYASDRHKTLWGDAVNYDGPGNEMVRRFAIDSAVAWVREYHIDGFRFDATFATFDDSPRHILADITTAARDAAAPRSIVIIAETYQNDPRYLRPASEGGFGFDAVWADDFHHAVHAYATGERSRYYADYAGTLDEIAHTINRGWLFEGQPSPEFPAGRGHSSDGVAARSFVYCLQNHDQVGNRPFGDRLSTLVTPDAYRAWSALLLLLPQTPLLFMGQEFGASNPFLYFSDHHPELAALVTEGHRREFGAYPEFADPAHWRTVPDPQSPATFAASQLDLSDRDRLPGSHTYALYRDLLSIRRNDAVLRAQDRESMHAYAATEQLLIVHQWHASEQRMIAANFGTAPIATAGIAEDVRDHDWRPLLSTDDAAYGGESRAGSFSAGALVVPPRTLVWFVGRDE